MSIDKLCRICLNSPGEISIFTISSIPISETELAYSDQLMRCTNVKISEDDGLPSTICSGCEAELIVSYRFLIKSETSDAYLRQIKLEPSIDTKLEIKIKEESNDPDYVQPHSEDVFSNEEFSNEEFLESDGQFSDHEPLERLLEKKKKKKVKRENGEPDSDEVLAKKVKIEDDLFPKPKRKYIRRKPLKRRKIQKIACEICGRLTTSQSAMIIHMRVHTNEKPFPCPNCNVSYKDKGSLKRHTERHHSVRERKVICEYCGNSFYGKRDIIVHMRTHTGEKPYVCDICNRSFAQQGPLIRHVRTHTGEKPYQCKLCSKTFADSNMLTRHKYVHISEKNFRCDLCGKSLKTKNALKTHLKNHTNESCFVCSTCGTTFKSKGNLTMHTIRVHSERSGQCTICNKPFSKLEEHMNRHTGIKPFECNDCSAKFPTKRSLSNHIKFRHTNTGKHKCSIPGCRATFPAPSMLQFHLLKYHINETPYVCEICSRGFFRVSDLSRHFSVSHSHLSKSDITLTLSKLGVKVPAISKQAVP